MASMAVGVLLLSLGLLAGEDDSPLQVISAPIDLQSATPAPLPGTSQRQPTADGTDTATPNRTLPATGTAHAAVFQSEPAGPGSAEQVVFLSDDIPPAEPPDKPIEPPILRDPHQHQGRDPDPPSDSSPEEAGIWPRKYPTGYSGPSGIVPRDPGEGIHFVPIEDRWRIGYPEWDRHQPSVAGHPRLIDDPFKNMPDDDFPFVRGRRLDPYHQNILKGDYPLIGQDTFLNLTAATIMTLESRDVPTPTTPFESTLSPGQEEFFGDPDQFFYRQDFLFSFDIFHGTDGFKQPDWRVRMSMIYNLNYLDVDELGIVNPDVREGTTRYRDDFALEEWFVESKLADTSPYYDTLSIRAGSQLFVSDFRGFIFSDVNRAVRIFGTQEANRGQFNVIWFDQAEKQTNSELNTFDDRHQNTFILNYYRQDFIWPGYDAEVSFHYNHDKATFQFDKNDFLVRPDPTGVFAPHKVDSYYFGIAGNGHIHRLNVSHALYWVDGTDQLNPIAGRPLEIDAWMAAVELSIDRDWMRFRTSYFYASGDDDVNDAEGGGFDAIFDNPNFAGGEFSYWQRQAIGLFGVQLVNRGSLVPNLRSSKTQGQTNFVNPGLHLFNIGVDADITPRTKLIGNVNFLWFEHPEVLETFVFQSGIDDEIGTDLSLGVEFRPLHNNNLIIVGGVSGLIPGDGFRDIYAKLDGETDRLFAAFLELIVEY